MLYQLLLVFVSTQLTPVVSPGQPRLLQYNFRHRQEEDVEKAVNDLSVEAKGRSLYVIADEVVHGGVGSDNLQTFCNKLLKQVPRLHLWAASCYHEQPAGWHVQYLTRPLRSSPAVLQEVQQNVEITEKHKVLAYCKRGVAGHTDGPPVRRLYHRGQGHSAHRPDDCVTCGREVASFLHSLRVSVNRISPTGTINSSTTPPCLQWRDVLVVCYYLSDPAQPGVLTSLREAGIPVRVMKDDNIEDVAMARSDVVWVAHGDHVRGLERKVVVCLLPYVDTSTARLHYISRCTSQLLIVSPDH